MYLLHNRRYTGSKYKLLDWIEEKIISNCEGEVFFDVFAGTAVVSERMKNHYDKIILNDLLYSNEAIYIAFFGNDEVDLDKIKLYQEKYKNIIPSQIDDNYWSKNFGKKFFSYNDAKIIGFIREDIEKNINQLNKREYNILIASLIYSLDKVANTVGHYDAYRKGQKLVDKFSYNLIDFCTESKMINIFREDSNKLAREVNADIAFIDPPYNSRQYSRFYHILENITQWKKPVLEGVALKPQTENMSDYCRSKAPLVFDDLVKNLNVKYLVVTYNNTYNSKSKSSENKITLKQIKTSLSNIGETIQFEKEHQFFNAGKTHFYNHKEYLFITKKGNS